MARVGTPVRAGEVLAELAGPSLAPEAVVRAFQIGPAPPPPRPLVDAIVRDADLAATAKAPA